MYAHDSLQFDLERRFYTARAPVPVRPDDSLEATHGARRVLEASERWVGEQLLQDTRVLTPAKLQAFLNDVADRAKSLFKSRLAAEGALDVNDAARLLDESRDRWTALVHVVNSTAPRDRLPFTPEQMAEIHAGTRSMLQASFPVDDETVHAVSRGLCVRFGFTSISIAGDSDISIPFRKQILERCERSLTQACTRLGIAEASFGGGETDFCIDRQLPLLAGSVARYVPSDGATHARIDWCDTSPRSVVSLMHEFCHRLDNRLGLMAETALQEPPLPERARPKGVFFSEMSSRHRAALPEADRAMRQVCSALGKQFGTVSDPLRVADRVFGEITDKFIALTMGSAFATSPKARVERWRTLVRSDDDALLKELMRRAKSQDPSEAGYAFFRDHKVRTGSPHPLSTAIESVHRKGTVAPTPGFFAACREVWPTLNALLPILERGRGVLHDEAANGEVKDLAGLQRFARPVEFFAVMVTDPQAVKDFAVGYFDSPRADPLWVPEAEKIITGLSKLLDAAGMQRTASLPILMGLPAKRQSPVERNIERGMPGSFLLASLERASKPATQRKAPRL